MEYFKRLTAALIEKPHEMQEEIEIIGDKEREEIIRISNGIQEVIEDNTIHRLFEQKAEQLKNKTALSFKGQELTYEDLNKRSNRLAGRLREMGVGPTTVVGLIVERSFEMVIGIVGILKAGGAYLPIDSDYPGVRKKYMLRDSNVPLVLTNCKMESLRDCVPEKVEVLTMGKEDTYSREEENPAHNTTGSNLVYLIYTSGSTGKPKGIMMEHLSLVNLIHYQFNYTNIPFNRVLQFITISFDVSFQEIFSTLLAGGTLYLVDKETRDNIPELFEFIKENEIETLFLPASFLKFVMNEKEYIERMPKEVRHIVTAGEQVIVSDRFRNYLKENHVWLHNHYGPAETHVVTTLTLDPNGEIPELPTIGKPVSNTGLYILDKRKSLLPIGVTGEIFIGGIQVSRGYRNREELTAERFLNNPFAPGEQMYKTGDLGRWLIDGNIEFLGRIDFQVKIRGFRVEPGEVESQLLTHNEITEAVVILREENRGNNRYLCGYFVSSRNISTSELREYLLKKLPDYMIPSYFVQVEKIPITPNGKIDRKSLPAPEIKIGEGYVAPRNKMEETLVEIWSEILGLEKDLLSIDSNFFELGGHSLKAISMANEIHKTFGVKITIQKLFRYSSIARVADLIKSSNITGFEEIEKQPEQPYYEMSYAQKRLWVIDKRNPGNTSFNMPARMALYEAVDEKIVRKALEQLVERHESLRTSFKEIDKSPVQVVKPFNDVEFNYEFVDLSKWDEVEQKSKCNQLIMEESAYVFNLETAPLFKAKLIKCKEEEYYLLINMHHIISDGESIEILKEEFITIYDAGKKGIDSELEPLKVQYKDYAAWHNRLLANEEKMRKANEFWKSKLSGNLPVLNLPYDFSHSSDSNESAGYRWVIPENLTNRLRTMALEQRASLFMVLLAGFNLLLSNITGQKDIIIAIPAAARQHEGLKNIIGMFVNTVILRNYISGDDIFGDFFKRFQDSTFKVLEYQDISLELICGQLKIKYPEVFVFFNMVNIGTTHRENLANLESYHLETVQEAKFDIVCYLTEYNNGIEINCHYFKDRFKALSIEKLMTLYAKVLDNISAEPGKKIGEYTLTGKKRTLKRKSPAMAGTVKHTKME
jgi:amino acid adenylation domain-containing protein